MNPPVWATHASLCIASGKAFHIGRYEWYIAPGVASRGVLKVRNGIIQEIGIANKKLTQGRGAQHRFLTSFSSA